MIENVEFIVACSGAVATSIVAIVQAIKGNTKTKTLKLAQIVQKLPAIINKVEKLIGCGSGEVKLQLVLNEVQMLCLQNSVEYVEEDFKVEIEKILTTPQKKEIEV